LTDFVIFLKITSFVLKVVYMSNLLFIIAVILVIGWLVGFFAFDAGQLIHFLLVFAVIAILVRLIRGKGV